MPQVKNAPKALNSLLERAYKSLIKRYDEKKAATLAWVAAKRAGWKKKNDKWIVASDIKWGSLRLTLEDNREFCLTLSDEGMDELVSLMLSEPEIDPNTGEIIVNEQVDCRILGVTILGDEPPYHKTLPELTEANIIQLSESPHISKVYIETDYEPPVNPKELVKLGENTVKLVNVPLLPEDKLTHDMNISIDSVIEDFDKKAKLLNPQLSIGHKDRMLEATDLMSFGRVVRLFADTVKDNTGKMVRMLMADIENVPQFIAELIRQKRYTRISGEFYPFFPLNDAVGIKLSDLKTIFIEGKEETIMPNTIPKEVLELMDKKDNVALKMYLEKMESERKADNDKVLKLSEQMESFKKDKEKLDAELKKHQDEAKKINEENEKLKLNLAEKEIAVHISDIKKKISDQLEPTDKGYGFKPDIVSKVQEISLKSMGFLKLSDNEKPLSDQIIDLMKDIAKEPMANILTLAELAPGGDHKPDDFSDNSKKDEDAKLRELQTGVIKLSDAAGKKITPVQYALLYNAYLKDKKYTIETLGSAIKNNIVKI